MSIETIHLTYKAKDQLIKLKKATGIQNWNVLCRWGFCISLAEPGPLPPVNLPNENAIEMTWKVFGGQYHDIYAALLRERCRRDGHSLDKNTLYSQFRLHLHRGIAKLSEGMGARNIEGIYNVINH